MAGFSEGLAAVSRKDGDDVNVSELDCSAATAAKGFDDFRFSESQLSQSSVDELGAAASATQVNWTM